MTSQRFVALPNRNWQNKRAAQGCIDGHAKKGSGFPFSKQILSV